MVDGAGVISTQGRAKNKFRNGDYAQTGNKPVLKDCHPREYSSVYELSIGLASLLAKVVTFVTRPIPSGCEC